MKNNKIINFIIGCVVTFILTIVMVVYFGNIMTPNNSRWCTNAIKAFHSLEDNSLDVIVYGSSRAWRGCNTQLMHSKYGLNAYNYGCNWQSINTTSLFLQDSLRTQAPKVVCIETSFVNQIEQDVDLNGQIYYTRVMPNFDGKRRYLRQCFGNHPERYLSYYFPLIMFHSNWNEIDPSAFNIGSPDELVSTRGFMYVGGVEEFEEPDYTNFSEEEIQDACIKVLDEIVEVCHSKGISVIFFNCPVAEEYHYGEAMKRYAEENDCAYLNLYEHLYELQIDWKHDMADFSHLNPDGAEKITSYLSEYIINNYSIY